MNTPLTIVHFTDPQCPFAYSAEPTSWRLQWLYGDQLQWQIKLIVLSGYQDEVPAITAQQAAQYQAGIRDRWGMPMNVEERPRQAHTIMAARAIIAAQIYAADKADALLRQLRIVSMSGSLLDEQSTIDGAAEYVGIPAARLQEWIVDAAVEERLVADAEAARNPGPLTAGLAHKLSQTTTGRTRYSAPSSQFTVEGAVVYELPGMWPLEAYEAAIANIAPNLTRRADPTTAQEVLEWANTPLAMQEVAVILGKEKAVVRDELQRCAQFVPIGQDGFWSLATH